jgi:hypothetical protein
MLPITDLTVFRLDDILSCLPAYLRGFGLLKATRLGPICRAQCGKECNDKEILLLDSCFLSCVAMYSRQGDMSRRQIGITCFTICEVCMDD